MLTLYFKCIKKVINGISSRICIISKLIIILLTSALDILFEDLVLKKKREKTRDRIIYYHLFFLI